MAPSGLRVTQFSLLRTLSRDGAQRMSDMAEALLLDRTALSRTLDPLVERGLIAIAPGSDARTRRVSITRAGERAIQAATPYWKRAQARVAGTLGSDKLEKLIGMLGEIETLHPDPGGRRRPSPADKRKP